MKSLGVAVLGAGIMGCSIAILLARRGHRVTLFDSASAPFSGASRWNEGKIHLGFLYSADPSLNTARKVIPGGLVFRPLIERLLGCSIEPAVTREDDLFLCHRDSVVPADSMHAYMRRVTQLIREHPDAGSYLAGHVGKDVERLSPGQLDDVSGSTDILAGFRVPERSVCTNWIADRFVDAVAAEPRIEPRMRTAVSAIRPAVSGDRAGPWRVVCSAGEEGPFDWVVNALWEGRMAIDLGVGIRPATDWSNRFRLALFIRTKGPVDVPSAIVATGPFGDVKNYGGRDFYVSWYPLGLLVDSPAVSPPVPLRPAGNAADTRALAILEELVKYVPSVQRIADNVESLRLEGGWVHAAGRGLLSDPASALHRRSRFGVVRSGTYLSVDTGKYSTAPWLAHEIAGMFQRASTA